MPRSPSRDLSDRFEGNRAYFHRQAPIARAKYALSIAALVLAVGWVVADVVFSSEAVPAHSHGPIADSHARWENDCAACHRPHSLREIGPVSIFRARDRWHDLTCEKCHAGPDHVATLAAADQQTHARCSNCHHEHGGRLNSLVRVSDHHCTRCHANLSAHHVAGTPTRAETIQDFTRDHLEFRPLTTQPERTLKFSHAVHMTPGQTSAPRGREAMTVGRLRELSGTEAVERYRKPEQGDADPISLNCAACHRLDGEAGTAGFDATRAAIAKAGEPSRAVLPTRAGGAHFLPVNFEAHCRACHPLQAPAGASAGGVIPGFRVRHRNLTAELAGELRTGYLKGLLATGHPALAAPVQPGGSLDPRHAIATKTLGTETDKLVADAERALLSSSAGCAKCHDVVKGQIARVPDRSVWLPAARFDHTRHKATTCGTCHPGTAGAFLQPGTALVEKEPVQIPGIDSCRACHSPSGTKVSLPDGTVLTGGGARHACVDCHNYHNAGHGLQGRGARARWPQRPLDLAEFLRGGK